MGNILDSSVKPHKSGESSPKTSVSPSRCASDWPRIPWNNGVSSGTIDTATLWRDAGAPERHREKLGKYVNGNHKWAAAYRELRAKLADGPLIVLLGSRGTGKTQMAVDLMAELCRSGKSGKYVKAMDLFREFRECFRKEGPSELQMVKRVCGYHCLIVDESQERGETDWENRTFTNIIDHRYDAKRPTILLSNQDAETFAKSVGESIVSRATETGIVVVCDWPSFRTKEEK